MRKPAPRRSEWRGRERPMGRTFLALGWAGGLVALGFALSIGGLTGMILVFALAASLGVAAFTRGYDSRDSHDHASRGRWKPV